VDEARKSTHELARTTTKPVTTRNTAGTSDAPEAASKTGAKKASAAKTSGGESS
jgi:hypothetical protein